MTPETLNEELRIQFPGLTEAQRSTICEATPKPLMSQDRLPRNIALEALRFWMMHGLPAAKSDDPDALKPNADREDRWQRVNRAVTLLQIGRPLPPAFEVAE